MDLAPQKAVAICVDELAVNFCIFSRVLRCREADGAAGHIFYGPLQCSLDDVAQIGRFLSDPCDRVFDGVIIFQNLRNAVVRCRAVF